MKGQWVNRVVFKMKDFIEQQLWLAPWFRYWTGGPFKKITLLLCSILLNLTEGATLLHCTDVLAILTFRSSKCIRNDQQQRPCRLKNPKLHQTNPWWQAWSKGWEAWPPDPSVSLPAENSNNTERFVRLMLLEWVSSQGTCLLIYKDHHQPSIDLPDKGDWWW